MNDAAWSPAIGSRGAAPAASAHLPGSAMRSVTLAIPMEDELVEPAVAARISRARAGGDGVASGDVRPGGPPARGIAVGAVTGGEAHRLFVGALDPGAFGVLVVEVRAVSPVRTYRRKAGGEGVLARVTLADATGEVDLVLWDDEARGIKDGPFQPGRHLVLKGATVKAGHRGGVELSLGAAVVIPSIEVATQAQGPAAAGAAAAHSTLEGLLVSLSDVRPTGSPPAVRFQVEARLLVAGREATIVAWDGAVKALREVPLATRVHLTGLVANPLLAGWYTADRDFKIARVGVVDAGVGSMAAGPMAASAVSQNPANPTNPLHPPLPNG